MITEDYVTYEVAKLLKEKGFVEMCPSSYGTVYLHNGKPIDEDEQYELESEGKEDEIEAVEGGAIYDFWNSNKQNEYGNIVSRPTLTVVTKWLRITHNIHVEIRITNHSLSGMIDIVKYYWVAFDAKTCRWMDESTMHHPIAFDTPEEAYQDAFKYVLTKLI